MQVWILSKGQMHEGGRNLGIYAERSLGQRKFLIEAQAFGVDFGIDSIHHADGAISLTSGSDWLRLEPHPVITHEELPAAPALPTVMPLDHGEYMRMVDANRTVPGCRTCANGGPVAHWPMHGFCRGGNAPGKPIRPHCTCDSCF